MITPNVNTLLAKKQSPQLPSPGMEPLRPFRQNHHPLAGSPLPHLRRSGQDYGHQNPGIVDRNLALHQDQAGYTAEVYAAITETVTGCLENMQLRQYPPEDRPQRRFETTGILLRIQSDWMANP